MSRAFVKEDENDLAELPDRPISPHRNFVTEAGLAAIEATLGRFEAAHRDATDKGDREAAAAALREVRYWKARRLCCRGQSWREGPRGHSGGAR